MAPLHFVMAGRSEFSGWNELQGSVHDEWHRFVRSEWAWLVQTYYELKSEGLTVTASENPERDKINIIHADDYLPCKHKVDYFAVVIVADRRVYFPGNCVVVQNLDQLFGRKSFWIPHWNQPGLKPRYSEGLSSDKEFTVAFAGIPQNTVEIAWTLAGEEFERPVKFSTLSPTEWNDYSDIDVVVAIRDWDGKSHREKPPTKLFNAWCAGVPFVGGMDSAYEQVGKPGINYLQVSSQKGLVCAIETLQDEQRWISMAEAGAAAAEVYSRKEACRRWVEVFSGPIQKQYSTWRSSGLLLRKLRIIASWLTFNVMRIKRRYLLVIGKY